MKKLLTLQIVIIFILISFIGCNVKNGSIKDSIDTILDTEVVVPNGNIELDVEATNGKKTEGYGCQVDTHIFKETNGNFYTEEDWKEWLLRIDDMNLQSIRTQVFPEWFERGNDNSDYNSFDYNSKNVDFNSIEMQQLYRLLDICQERNIKVDLSFYGCNRIFTSQDGLINGSWLAHSNTTNWITAPKKVDSYGNEFKGYEEYAESVSALLKYLTEQKKYTCIYEFSLFPEPNLSFIIENGKSSDTEFFKFYNIVYNKLKNDGIWGKIKCSGPGDCANDLDTYKNYLEGLDGIVVKNTSSVYAFNNESTNKSMYDFANNNVTACDEKGNTWGVCECGSNRFIDPANQSDIDTYDRAIYLARLVINFTNAGCTNLKYWVLNDVYYDGYVMRLGLWNLANDKLKAVARPQFYSWSLITKYTDFGSDIYPVISSDNDICMVAYRLPTGEWSYLIANSGQYSKKISIVSKHSTAQTSMNVYELSGSSIPDTNRTITSSKTVSMENCIMNITLRANSFTVISNK